MSAGRRRAERWPTAGWATARRAAAGWALTAGVLFAACGRYDSEGTSERRQAVAFGSEDAPTAIAAVEHDSGDAWDLCSGVLVAPGIVLTAAHCVTAQFGELDCESAVLNEPVAPSTLRVSFAPDLAGAVDPAWEFYQVQEAQLIAPVGTSLCGQDVALLYLKEEVDAEVAVPVPVAEETAQVGDFVRLAGYGAGHPSGTGQRVKRISSELEVVCRGADCNGVVLGGFGGGPVSAPFAGPHEFIIEPGACPGDSGGPALRAGSVVGLVSRGFPDCTAPVLGLPREAVARSVREHAAATGSEIPAWAELTEAGTGGHSSLGGSTGAGGDAWAHGGLGGTTSPPPPATTSRSGCQLGATGERSTVASWLASLLLLALLAGRRRPSARLLPLAACVTLLGCTRQAQDTEGRTFDLSCKNDKCVLEPTELQEGSSLEEGARPWEPARPGRVLLACPQGERGDGRECRPLACDGDAVCSKLGGARVSCLEGLCQSPDAEVTSEDRLALCLAGTGIWSDSPEQRSRFAMAQSCRPPCEVPAMCRQLK